MYVKYSLRAFSRFDDLISKASTLENRFLEHKRERKGNTMVNKMESVMVGIKKPPTTLKVKYTAETTKPTTTEQETPPKRPSIKEQQEQAYTFHHNDLESLFKQKIES